jgi:hypothetical protein
LLDSWHKAAAEAKFDAYFKMTEDAVFIGTDATEKQTRFQEFAKPYFDKGRLEFYSIRTSYLF